MEKDNLIQLLFSEDRRNNDVAIALLEGNVSWIEELRYAINFLRALHEDKNYKNELLTLLKTHLNEAVFQPLNIELRVFYYNLNKNTIYWSDTKKVINNYLKAASNYAPYFELFPKYALRLCGVAYKIARGYDEIDYARPFYKAAEKYVKEDGQIHYIWSEALRLHMSELKGTLNYQELIDTTRKAAQLMNVYANGNLTIGETYARWNEETNYKYWREQKEAYEQVLALEPNTKQIVHALNGLAIIYAKVDENYEKALELANKAYKKSQISGVMGTLGYIYWKKKEYKTAMYYFEKILWRTDCPITAAINAAYMYEELDQPSDVKRCLSRIRRRDKLQVFPKTKEVLSRDNS